MRLRLVKSYSSTFVRYTGMDDIVCPKCGLKLPVNTDSVEVVGEPGEGVAAAVGICMNCGDVAISDKDGTRSATIRDIAELVVHMSAHHGVSKRQTAEMVGDLFAQSLAVIVGNEARKVRLN